MKNGFQLLRTKRNDKTTNIDELEEKLGCTFPSKYRLFVETFDFGMDIFSGAIKYMCEYLYLIENNKELITMPQYYDNTTFSFAGFFDFKYSVDIYEKSQKKRYSNDLFFRYNLFPIGTTDYQAHLCVGMSEKVLDQIIVAEHESGEIKFVSNDIFTFVRGIRSVALENRLKYLNINTSQLYKNWNEDFWRVREKDE